MKANTMKWIVPVAFIAALAYTLQHFLLPIVWGAVLAIAVWPLVLKLEARGFSSGLSVSTVSLSLIVGFGLPAYAVISALTPEVAAASGFIHQLNKTGLPSPSWAAHLPVFSEQVINWWNEHLSQPGAVMNLLGDFSGSSVLTATGKIGGMGASIAANAFYIFLALLSFIVFQLNARTIVVHLDSLGGKYFSSEYALMRRLLPLSIRGTAVGLGSVAILEGLVLGIAYHVAGAPMPALLGVLTGYMALIPGGAPLAFLSVSMLLLAQGSGAAAAGLAMWGALELFLVDKFLRPRIIGSSVELPFLAVLFGLLGGVSAFGVIGLFIGPFLMTVLFSVIRKNHDDLKA